MVLFIILIEPGLCLGVWPSELDDRKECFQRLGGNLFGDGNCFTYDECYEGFDCVLGEPFSIRLQRQIITTI